jgi:type IV pilus assembly protein PilO
MAESALARVPKGARYGIGAGLLVLGGLAYYVVFYSDIAGQLDAALAERQSLQGELVKAKAAETAYQKDLEELARRRERERELNKILPATTEYPAFLGAVQTVANMSGVELSAWSPEPEVIEKFYAKVPMHVEVRGRFHQIAKFFFGIGQSDRIMNMENIAISKPTLVDHDVIVSVSGLATAFRALGANEGTDGATAQKRGG